MSDRRTSLRAGACSPHTAAAPASPWAVLARLASPLLVGLYAAAVWAAPVHDAVANHDPRALRKALHDDPASVNAEDEKHATPLRRAVLSGQPTIVQILLSKGARLDIYCAAGLGKADDLMRFLKDAPRLANSFDSYGWSPLHYAVQNGRLDAARLLLDHGADPSALARLGTEEPTPPLYMAVFNGNMVMAKLLVGRGADVRFKDSNGGTLLHTAVFRSPAMAEFLLDQKLDVNAKDNEEQTPLHNAAFGGHKETAALLVARGADLEAKNKEGHTPLHEAARWAHVSGSAEDNLQTAEFLLGKGAKLDFATAVRLNHVRETSEMLRADPHVWERHNGEDAPLEEAASYGYAAMARLLLDHGAGDEGGADRALSTAAAMGQREVAALLLERGASLDAPMIAPPLWEASRYGHADVIRLLLRHKASVRIDSDEAPNWPLVLAAQGGHVEVIDVLLAADRDAARTPLRRGRTVLNAALEYAVANGQTEAARLLIARGADPRTPGLGEGTLLHDAARGGRTATAAFLLERGADVNARRPRDGRTPLHDAAKADQEAVSKMLLERGADANAVDKDGDTPLHVAAGYADIDLVRLLLAHKADAGAVNRAGQLPWQLADAEGQDEIAGLLRQAAEK